MKFVLLFLLLLERCRRCRRISYDTTPQNIQLLQITEELMKSKTGRDERERERDV